MGTQQTSNASHQYATGLAPAAVPVFVVLLVFAVLSIISVGLRIYCRRVLQQSWIMSDILILLALIIYISYIIASILSLFVGGTGWHENQVQAWQLEVILKITLYLQISYAVGMGLVKSSVCVLLMKIFPQRQMQLASRALIVLTVCWSIMTILIGLLICRPISKLWNAQETGTCGNQNDGFAAVSAVDIFVDLLIIFLPIPQIMKLNMATSHKIGVAAIFLLGLVTIAITALRIWVQLSTPYTDFTYHSTSIYIWTIVEFSVAIMVTCAAGLRPVLEKVMTFSTISRLLSSWRSRSRHSSTKISNTDIKGTRKFNQIDEIELALNPTSGARGRGLTHVEAGGEADQDGRQGSDTGSNENHPQGITVESGWSILSERIEKLSETGKVGRER